MKYSILYFNYDPEHKNSDLVKESLYSIIKNSTGADYEIQVMERKGILSEINRGFRESRGDYIVFFSNDIIIEQPGWLDNFAVPGVITSWRSTVSSFDSSVQWKEVDAAMMCVPRDVWEKIGDWDMQFEGGYGYADNDFLHRATLLGIELREVPIKLTHHVSTTYDAYPELGKSHTLMGRNCDLLLKKWNLGRYAQ